MIVFLRIVGAIAACSALLGGFDLAATWRPGATVFQQISARVDIGFSALVMVCAFGFSSAIAALRDAAPQAVAQPSGTVVAQHEGINVFKSGLAFVAVVRGERIESGDLAILRQLITARLHKPE